MSNEKLEFSKRLRAAMRAKGWADRPAELEKKFNARYAGPSVTFQSVSAWIGGRSMPQPDKLRVLAEMLDLEMHVLRDGSKSSSKISEPESNWPGKLSEPDRAAIVRLLELPASRRQLVRALIEALAERG